MASWRFRIISKKLVIPSSSTPTSLRHYRLSLLDQLCRNLYMPIAFFYPRNTSRKSGDEVGGEVLQASLSKILSAYYPFAGRLKDNQSVDSNDMGAMFLEAQIRCPMSEILKESKTNALDIAFPKGMPWSQLDESSPPVVAQLSHFDCGGKALSLCMSHKIGDGLTMCNFASHWAHWTRHHAEPETLPQWNGASIIPSTDDPSIEPVFGMREAGICVTKRFVFPPEKLNKLKAMAAAESQVESPTRVEVVSALIQKCLAVAATTTTRSRSFKPNVINSIVNLRPLIGPPASQYTAGNLYAFSSMLITEERQVNFSRLVTELRQAKARLHKKYSGMNPTEAVSAMLKMLQNFKALPLDNNEIDLYNYSSFNRFPAASIDFGWGKPTRVSLAAHHMQNFVILMDNLTVGGIDALITLEEEVMSVLEKDHELLAFASPGSIDN